MKNRKQNLKIIVLAGIITFLASCGKEGQNYQKLSGRIEHAGAGELYIKSMDDKVLKTIKVNDDGTFSDTLNLGKGFYLMDYDRKYFKLFMPEAADISLQVDNEDFENSLSFAGKAGAAENNLTLRRLDAIKSLFYKVNEYYRLDKAGFDTAMKKEKQYMKSLLEKSGVADSLYITDAEADSKGLFEYLERYYEIKHRMLELVGKPSPEFNGYENAAGGKSSLKDFRGKYVYIDNWATWCRPCLAEIPALKRLESIYGDKIHFVSISYDRESDYQTWKDMVKNEGLTGAQLFAHGDNTFADAYQIISIPRFILIDPEGKVYDPDAPRPSSDEIEPLLKKLIGE